MELVVNNIVDVTTKDGRTVQVDMTTPANWKQQLRGAYSVSEAVFKMLSLPSYDYLNPQPTDLKKLHQGIANRAKKALNDYAKTTEQAIVTKRMVNDLMDDKSKIYREIQGDILNWLNQSKSKKIPTLNVNYLIQQENTEFSNSIVGDLKDYTIEKEEKVVEVKPVAKTKPVVELRSSDYEDRTVEMTNGYTEVMKELEALKNESVEVETVEPIESVDMEEVTDLLDGLSAQQIALLKNKLNKED